MPTLVIRHPDGSEQEQDLANQLTIGRADGNDLVLVEGGVSRKHARIFSEGADVMIEDTGSANGTFVDGERIAGPTKLSARAQVVIGDYEIVLKGAGGARPSSKAPGKSAGRPAGSNGEERTGAVAPVKPARATKVVPVVKGGAPASKAALATRPKGGGGAAGGPALRGLTGPWMNKTFPLKGKLVVGRVAGVDIQLEDDSVSRRHAELEVRGREVVLRDLGSANGTAVNGSPVGEDQVLKSGDIIQFGVVEMSYEGPGLAGASPRPGGLAARPGARPGGRPGRDEELDELPAEVTGTGAGGFGGKKKKLIMAGGGVGVLLLAVITFKALQPEEVSDLKPIGPPRPNVPAVLSLDEYLANCRQFASAEMTEPNWDKATDACNMVLKENPIHPEALQLIRKIELEKTCQKFYDKGKKHMRFNRDEEAVEELAQIKTECTTYYSKGKQLVREAAVKVKKKASEDCKQYMGNNQYKQALPRCQVYMQFACQDMKPEDLTPPPTQTLSLSGSLKKNQWRPSDKMFLNLLIAREKEDPGAPAWKCIEQPMLRPEPPPPSPSAYAESQFKKRYDDPELQLCLKLYFDGKFREATSKLGRIQDMREKAKWHEIAKNLATDMNNVNGLYNDGQNDLSGDKPEQAEEAFRDALGLDEKIVLGDEKMKLPEAERKKELDKMQSYFRRNINTEMAQKCFERGVAIAERQDLRGACKVWKLGYSFYRGNTDLLKAVAEACTSNAKQSFDAAQSCDDLKVVLEWAVDGDGFKEKVEAKMTELACAAQ